MDKLTPMQIILIGFKEFNNKININDIKFNNHIDYVNDTLKDNISTCAIATEKGLNLINPYIKFGSSLLNISEIKLEYPKDLLYSLDKLQKDFQKWNLLNLPIQSEFVINMIKKNPFDYNTLEMATSIIQSSLFSDAQPSLLLVIHTLKIELAKACAIYLHNMKDKY